jgi:folylpolyglutamate synthase/dihydropteroate synthase
VGSRIVVLGMLAGRDATAAVEALAPARPDLVVCTAVDDGARGRAPAELAAACEAMGIPAEVVEDPGAAVARALAAAGEEDLLLVCGSMRLPALVRPAFLAP